MLFITKFSSQKGMTLIELLAAITILGIVFIGLLSIFPQMTKFNMQTEFKLETMNYAKIELAELKDSPKRLCGNEVGRESDYIIYEYYQEDGYLFEVDYFVNDVLAEEDDKEVYICDEEDTKGDKDKGILTLTRLNKIHIKVIKDEKIISETFGYLEQ